MSHRDPEKNGKRDTTGKLAWLIIILVILSVLVISIVAGYNG